MNGVALDRAESVSPPTHSDCMQGWTWFASVFVLLVVGAIAHSSQTHGEAGQLIQFVAACLAVIPVCWEAIRSQFRVEAEVYSELLVAMAVLGALFSGEFFVAAIVPLILQLGHYLEQRSVQGTAQAIEALSSLTTPSAVALRNGEECEIDANCLHVGELVVVRPGQVIPCDGAVMEGMAEIDESSITGESRPRDAAESDHVFAGSINLSGRLVIQVEKVGDGTTAGRIARLLKQAKETKPRSVRTLEQYAAWMVPGVVLLAAGVLLVSHDVQRVVTVFIVSCPCALVLSAPSATVAALAAAYRNGLLVKNIQSLEALVRVSVAVFDKTGTLTEGKFSVLDVMPAPGRSAESVLELARVCATGSNHPISRAIATHSAKSDGSCPQWEVSQWVEIAGRGIECMLQDGRMVRLGRLTWIRKHVTHCPSLAELDPTRESSNTQVAVALDADMVGRIELADPIRRDAADTLNKLRAAGVQEIAMLTGDLTSSALAVAEKLDVDTFQAELLPEEKLAAVEQTRSRGHILTVGDGINDALALAASHVGIVVGRRGNDISIGSSDIVLVGENLSGVVYVLRLARRFQRIVGQNILLAIMSGCLMLILGASGILGPISGALVHNLGTICVLINSSRLLRSATANDNE